MPERPANDGKPWTRDELIVAFDLYCRTPFQRTKASNPEVKGTASLLRRTPAAVARKLGNFGAFDPQLKERGIGGLPHVSQLDREVWNEFHRDWNALVEEARRLRNLLGEIFPDEEACARPSGPSERLQVARARIHQAFFRDAVLSAYGSRCCITGLMVRECLVASHVVPWARREETRSDPTNGLCLSATFDRLFDAGLITVTDGLTVRVSEELRAMRDPPCCELISCYHDRRIQQPSRFAPKLEYLTWHRSNVFQG